MDRRECGELCAGWKAGTRDELGREWTPRGQIRSVVAEITDERRKQREEGVVVRQSQRQGRQLRWIYVFAARTIGA
jgi:hypothetical protein